MNLNKKRLLEFVTAQHGPEISACCENRLTQYKLDELIPSSVAQSVLSEACLANQQAQPNPSLVPMTSRNTHDTFDEVSMSAVICAAVA